MEKKSKPILPPLDISIFPKGQIIKKLFGLDGKIIGISISGNGPLSVNEDYEQQPPSDNLQNENKIQGGVKQ